MQDVKHCHCQHYFNNTCLSCTDREKKNSSVKGRVTSGKIGQEFTLWSFCCCASENESTTTKESSMDYNDVEFRKQSMRKRKCNPIAKSGLKTHWLLLTLQSLCQTSYEKDKQNGTKMKWQA